LGDSLGKLYVEIQMFPLYTTAASLVPSLDEVM